MLKRVQGGRKLTLTIRGERITADRFKRAVDSFFGVLKEVANEVTGKGGSVEWVVTAKEGSIQIGAAAESSRPSVPVQQVVEAVSKGIRQIQTSRSRPKFFNDDALHDARELAQLIDGKSIQVISVRRSRDQVRVVPESVLNVDAMLGGVQSEEGTIEGSLEMISSRGSLHVGVWDSLTDQQVRCFVRPSLLDEVKSAFGRRVAVSGTIRYRANGDPATIEVEQLEVFPPDDQLPTADDVLGILATV